MSDFGEFYRPDEIDLQQVVPAYQEAFKEEPWNEVSKCVDAQTPQRCAGGLSSVEIGQVCASCMLVPTAPAYEVNELVERFSRLGETRPVSWYIERYEGRIALAAVSWLTEVDTLSKEKYGDVPDMGSWLESTLGTKEFIYLDEIFRDKTVQAQGNLSNFKAMAEGFGAELGNELLGFRTKHKRLLGKAQKVFGSAALISRPEEGGVPDWRKRAFVVIQLGESKI